MDTEFMEVFEMNPHLTLRKACELARPEKKTELHVYQASQGVKMEPIKGITDEQLAELILFGKMIDVKVSSDESSGERIIYFRKYAFNDYRRAARMLQRIRDTELPESFEGLI